MIDHDRLVKYRGDSSRERLRFVLFRQEDAACICESTTLIQILSQTDDVVNRFSEKRHLSVCQRIRLIRKMLRLQTETESAHKGIFRDWRPDAGVEREM